MPRLSHADRNRAIGLLEAGQSCRMVARRLNVHHSTILRLKQRQEETGQVADRPRPCQPRITTARQDRLMRLTHLRNKFQPATQTARTVIGQHGRPVCGRTVRNRLRAEGLRPYCPYTGSVLKARHRRERVQWARAHRRWILRQWSSVLFSDEKQCQCFRADGRTRVYRQRNQRFAEACIQEIDRWGGPSIMVWAGISANSRTDLVFIQGNLNAHKYRAEVLEPVVQPALQNMGPGAVFQQDNARPHIAQHCRQFFDDNDIEVLPWPALSPDLNPIENLWDLLARRLRQRPHPPETLPQLRAALTEEWTAIPQEDIRSHCLSMRRRLTAVIDANGGHIHY